MSAKTGANIKEFFKTLAQNIAGVGKKTPAGGSTEPEKLAREPERKTGGNKLVNPGSMDSEVEKKKRKGCC